MHYFFELSKEYDSLPKYEILSCLKAEKISYRIIESNEDVLIIDTNKKIDNIDRLSDRISLSFFINELLFTSRAYIKELKKNFIDINIKKNETIAVRYRNRSKSINSLNILKTLAELYSKKRIVSLENPNVEIRCLIRDSMIYVGTKIYKIDRSQYEKRKVQYRPFFSPVSLHPKIARVMVNLSTVEKGNVLLDPFCGTGGILIEAGLLGIKTIGVDIEKKMIEGCKQNLKFYNLKEYKLFHSDIGSIYKYISKVDTVVTDLPYGKSTTTKGENICQLYDRSFQSISNILKKNGRAVIGLSNYKMMINGKKYLRLIEEYSYKVHRSLTRYIGIYEKKVM